MHALASAVSATVPSPGRPSRSALGWLSFVGISALANLGAAEAADGPRPPNILLIIADDLGARLGCYGDPLAVTPHLDALAAQGTRFQNAYCQYPTCGPSRASLLSGTYPFESGYTHNRNGTYPKFMPTTTSLPRLFRDSGYRTARVGKVFHMDVPSGMGQPGTDDPDAWDTAINPTGWDAQEEHWASATSWGSQDGPSVRVRYAAPEIPDEAMADGHGLSEAITLLHDLHPAKTGKPFFLAYGTYRPHPPMLVPKRHWDAIDPARIVLPVVPANDRDDIPLVNWHRPGPDYNDIPEVHARRYTQAYYAAVHFVDDLAGRLVQALHQEGLDGNTIIVFTGDQGFHLGEHGHWHKSSMLEESRHVPLIIVDPRARVRGGRVDGLVGLIDVYPTLCALTGVTPRHALSGISLKPHLDEATLPTKSCEFIMGTPGGFTLRTDRYAYTEWRKGGKRTGDAMLYDLQRDPHEFTNLIADPSYRTVREDLERHLQQRIPE